MKTKYKTSVSLSVETTDRIKKIGGVEDRSVSYLVEKFSDMFARLAEDAAEYGVSVNDLGQYVERLGDEIKRDGHKKIHRPQQ